MFVHPKKAIAINALTLLVIGVVAFMLKSSPTALIPAAFGVLLGICFLTYDKNNKVVAHVCLVLMLMVFGSLFMPLKTRVAAADLMGICRVGVMQLITLYAIICFVRNFIEARRN
mgnify:FL=1